MTPELKLLKFELKPKSVEKYKVRLDDRAFLWALENECIEKMGSVANGQWMEAYRQLAWAANVLDAFMGRSTMHLPLPNEELEK